MLGTVTVVNKRNYSGEGIYIGRPSILGNPFSHLARAKCASYHVPTREDAIDAYREWVLFSMEKAAREAYQEIYLLSDRVKNGEDLVLICWCHPLACHGDVIRDLILEEARGEGIISSCLV